MADNPFADTVNQLNGKIAGTNYVRSLMPSDIDFNYSDEDTIVVNSDRYSGLNLGGNPGMITVINADYAPDTVYDGTLFQGFFGKISFQNDTYHEYLYILGFSSDGLMMLGESRQSSLEEIQQGKVGIFAFNPNGSAENLSFPLTFETNPAAICFAEGARIEAADGMVAVEDLAVGDMVRTLSGAMRPVRWIGTQIANPGVHRRPDQLNPVLVRAHAFGPDLPQRDVRLSPGHAVHVDGVLVPVGQLINGATIVQQAVDTIRYYHVELDSHDLLMAEGLPCESYLDDGNRLSFLNGGAFTQLHGRLDPKSWDNACAPMVAGGPQLEAIRQRLHTQAEALGWQKREEAGLAIVANGAEITPLHSHDNRYWFLAPEAAELRLRSNHGVLAHVVPGLADKRTLGVAVSEMRIDGQSVDLDDAAFGAGFHAIERHDEAGWRWTDGDAAIACPLTQPAIMEVQLVMTAPSWRIPVPQLRVVA